MSLTLCIWQRQCHSATLPHCRTATHGAGDEFVQLIVISRLCNCKVEQFDWFMCAAFDIGTRLFYGTDKMQLATDSDLEEDFDFNLNCNLDCTAALSRWQLNELKDDLETSCQLTKGNLRAASWKYRINAYNKALNFNIVVCQLAILIDLNLNNYAVDRRAVFMQCLVMWIKACESIFDA